MKYCRGIFFALIAIGSVVTAHGAGGFLSAESFPKTFDDLSFVERVEILREGYAPWESEYDDNGNCVKNCTYHGINIKEERSIIERETAEAEHRARMYMIENNMYETHVANFPQQNVSQLQPQPTVNNFPANTGWWLNEDENNYDPVVSAFPTVESQPTTSILTATCVPSNSSTPANQNIPYGIPLVGNPRVSSPYGERIHPISKKRQLHKGIDYAVPNNTVVFSPANGTVARIWTDATCGNGLVVDHFEGFSTLYCHLNSVTVSLGDNVRAGCPIALTGNTGGSTGPHLHYGIYSNKNLIDPTSFTRQ